MIWNWLIDALVDYFAINGLVYLAQHLSISW